MGTEQGLIGKIIYTNEEIVAKCKAIAAELNEKYRGQEVVAMTIMSGGLPFTLELIKHLEMDVYMDFINSSSYEFDKKISEPKIQYDAKIPLTGKNVVVLDDVIDSGETIQKIVSVLEGYNPKSISVAGLVVKPHRIKPSVDEFYGWELKEDEFLIGFGLDWNEKFRNLPYIAGVNKAKIKDFK